MRSRKPLVTRRSALRASLALTVGTVAMWSSQSSLAQSPVTLPPFQAGHQTPVLVLGGVEPLQVTPSGRMIATQQLELQPPVLEPRAVPTVPAPQNDRRIEKLTPIEQPRIVEQPRVEQPRIVEGRPLDNAKLVPPAQRSEQPRIVDRPRDGEGPRAPREGDRNAEDRGGRPGPEGRSRDEVRRPPSDDGDFGRRDSGRRDDDRREGDRRDDDRRDDDRRDDDRRDGDRRDGDRRDGDRPSARGDDRNRPGDSQDRRGFGFGSSGMPGRPGLQRQGMPGMPGMGPGPNQGRPNQGPNQGGPNQGGPNQGGPNRGGPDMLEEQLRSVERLFNSPLIKRYLELMEENAELRAQVKLQEKLNAHAHPRDAERPPVHTEAQAERGRDERVQAERQAMERRVREMMEQNAVVQREMAQQIEKLKDRLHDAQAQLEKTNQDRSAQERIREIAKQRDAEAQEMLKKQEAKRRSGKPGEEKKEREEKEEREEKKDDKRKKKEDD